MPIDLSIFHKAIKVIEEKRAEYFFSLTGSSNALFLSMLQAPYLLLCCSEDSANEFYSDAVFWSESFSIEKPLLIPPKDDLLRLKNLKGIYSTDNTKLITSVEAALSP